MAQARVTAQSAGFDLFTTKEPVKLVANQPTFVEFRVKPNTLNFGSGGDGYGGDMMAQYHYALILPKSSSVTKFSFSPILLQYEDKILTRVICDFSDQSFRQLSVENRLRGIYLTAHYDLVLKPNTPFCQVVTLIPNSTQCNYYCNPTNDPPHTLPKPIPNGMRVVQGKQYKLVAQQPNQAFILGHIDVVDLTDVLYDWCDPCMGFAHFPGLIDPDYQGVVTRVVRTNRKHYHHLQTEEHPSFKVYTLSFFPDVIFFNDSDNHTPQRFSQLKVGQLLETTYIHVGVPAGECADPNFLSERGAMGFGQATAYSKSTPQIL